MENKNKEANGINVNDIIANIPPSIDNEPSPFK